MRKSITQATKRNEYQQLARSIAIGCTMVFSSQWSAIGQEATCGCEVSVSNCDGTCSKGKKAKQLSIAQQFLQQFDRIGDEIEAQTRFKPVAIRKGKSASATCGVEAQGPSCGTEISVPTCGSELNGPPPGLESAKPKPLYQYEPPSFQTDPPASPIKKRPPSTPMHPHAPTSQQAIGKIIDKPGNPSIPVRKQEPAKVSEPGNVAEPAIVAEPAKLTEPQVKYKTPEAQQDAPDAMPKSATEPFAPRLPQVPPKAEGRVTSPSPNMPQSSKLPSLPGVPVGPTTPVRSPELPQSQDEIPDVLVDPFRDDVRWRNHRDQMNGVLQTGGSVIERSEPSTPAPSPIRLRAVPAQELDETSTGTVISIGPSFDSSDSSVVTSSHLQRIPARVHTVKRNVPALDEEVHPVVKRTMVPTRK
ncbi:MAG: hypothetical protein ACK5OC_16460 [Pirellula sp.]